MSKFVLQIPGFVEKSPKNWVTDHSAEKKAPVVGSVRWMIQPQVGHAIMSSSGFDFIGKVEIVKHYPMNDEWVQIKPIKILWSNFDAAKEDQVLEMWMTPHHLYTEEEINAIDNKSLIIRLLFEGTDLLVKLGAIAAPSPPPSPPPPAGTWDPITIELKNLDDNQDDTVTELFDDLVSGNKKLFVISNGSTISTIQNAPQLGKGNNYKIVIMAKKNKAAQVKTILNKKLQKALDSFAIKKKGGVVISIK